MDGVLTATLDSAFAGVSLFASFSVAGVSYVRFSRADGTPVRSGSPAPAIANEALAYDAEMPLGAVTQWVAVAYASDGSVLATSAPVSLMVPGQSARSSVWLKSVSDPSLSVLAQCVGDIPEGTLAARQNFSDVLGVATQVASFDVWSAESTDTWSFWARTPAERKALVACLQSGILLLQSPADFDDMFVLAGDISRAYAGSSAQDDQIISTSFAAQLRPPVEGSPLLQPGRTWQWLKDNQGSWTSVKSSYDTWLHVNV